MVSQKVYSHKLAEPLVSLIMCAPSFGATVEQDLGILQRMRLLLSGPASRVEGNEGSTESVDTGKLAPGDVLSFSYKEYEANFGSDNAGDKFGSDTSASIKVCSINYENPWVMMHIIGSVCARLFQQKRQNDGRSFRRRREAEPLQV